MLKDDTDQGNIAQSAKLIKSGYRRQHTRGFTKYQTITEQRYTRPQQRDTQAGDMLVNAQPNGQQGHQQTRQYTGNHRSQQAQPQVVPTFVCHSKADISPQQHGALDPQIKHPGALGKQLSQSTQYQRGCHPQSGRN